MSVAKNREEIRTTSEELLQRNLKPEDDQVSVTDVKNDSKTNYISNNCIVININNTGGKELENIVENIQKISMLPDSPVPIQQKSKSTENRRGLPKVKNRDQAKTSKNYTRITEEDNESNDERYERNPLKSLVPSSSKRQDPLHSSIEVCLPNALNSRTEPNNRYVRSSKGDHKFHKERMKASQRQVEETKLRHQRKKSIDASHVNNHRLNAKFKLNSSNQETGTVLRHLERLANTNKSKTKDGRKLMNPNTSFHDEKQNATQEIILGGKTVEEQKYINSFYNENVIPKSVTSFSSNFKNMNFASEGDQGNDFFPQIDRQKDMNTPTILASSIPVVDAQ